MYSPRRISIATGALFIIATVAALAAAALSPLVTGPGYLAGVAAHSGRMAPAALVYLVAAGTSVGIAIALYPLLKKTSPALALGAVVFRTIEAVFYTAVVVSLLSIRTLGRQFVAGPAGDRAAIQAIADYVMSVRDHSNLVAVFALSVGSLMYSVVFYRSRLVPRWLAVWGMAAALLIGGAGLVSLFSDDPVTGQYLLILPVFLWELVIAIWLLVRGFTPGTGGSPAQIAPAVTARHEDHKPAQSRA